LFRKRVTMAKKFMHTTKNGDQIALSKLEDSHLQNIINFLQRKAKEGVRVRHGGGTTADDIWYDEDMLYGEEALKHLHYGEYIAEQKRRPTMRETDPQKQTCPVCKKGKYA
jgi:hypothetical protein